jgi:hypothetical protein
MNDLVDNLRAGLASLADEARPVDLHDRVLRSSHRLGRQRTLAGSGAGVGAVAAVTVIALAVVPLPDDAPVPPGGPGGSSAPPTVAPTPSEAPTEGPDLPAEAMLQPADLGPDSRVHNYEVVGSDVGSTGNLTYLTSSCGESVGPYVGDGQPESWASVELLSGELFVGKQEMFRSKSGGAEQFMADLRVALPNCERVNHFWTEFEEVTSDLTLVRSDFAGAESLLVEQVLVSQDETVIRYHAVIRQADLISQIWLEDVDEPRALEIAMAAAQRLCVATDC